MHADLDEATQERVIEAMRGAVGADAIKPLHAQA